MPKLQPAVQTLFIDTGSITASPNFTSKYLDIAQCVSIVSRRAYRQGHNWAVAQIKIMTANPSAVIIEKIPENWISIQAWQKAFALWQKHNGQVLKDNPSLKPKYYDFKVGFDSSQIFSNNLLPHYKDPSTGTITPFTAGEWVQSCVQMPNDPTTGLTDEQFLVMTGPGNSARNPIIEAYAQSRAAVNASEPALPAGYDTNWMVQLFDSGENFEEIAADLQADNDVPPYPQFEYVGSLGPVVHDYVTLTTTSVGGQTIAKGGMFPCGLIKFGFSSGVTQNYIIQIDLVPGSTRGYMATPMLKM